MSQGLNYQNEGTGNREVYFIGGGADLTKEVIGPGSDTCIMRTINPNYNFISTRDNPNHPPTDVSKYRLVPVAFNNFTKMQVCVGVFL